MGGPADFIEKYDGHLAKAPVVRTVSGEGYVASVNTRAIGNAIIELGGGRRKVGEALDLSVGFSDIARVGAELGDDAPLAVIHAASEADAEKAEQNLRDAYELEAAPPEMRPVICEILTG